MEVGDKFEAIVPIQVSEDCCWEPGTVVEVVQRTPHEPNDFGDCSVELEAADGQIGSFAAIDMNGEHALFRAKGGA